MFLPHGQRQESRQNGLGASGGSPGSGQRSGAGHDLGAGLDVVGTVARWLGPARIGGAASHDINMRLQTLWTDWWTAKMAAALAGSLGEAQPTQSDPPTV